MARINLLREAPPLIVDISLIIVSSHSALYICGEKCSQLKTNKLPHGAIFHFLSETAYPQTLMMQQSKAILELCTPLTSSVLPQKFDPISFLLLLLVLANKYTLIGLSTECSCIIYYDVDISYFRFTDGIETPEKGKCLSRW